MYRRLVDQIKVKIDPNFTIPVIKAQHYVSRYGTELELHQYIQNRAVEILDEAEEKGIQLGKSPTGLAAAAIYIVGIERGEKKTQNEIVKVARITEVTLRNRYKELVKKLKLDVGD